MPDAWLILLAAALAAAVGMALWAFRSASGRDLLGLKVQLDQLNSQIGRIQGDAAAQVDRRIDDLGRKVDEQSHQLTMQVNQRLDGMTRQLGERLGEINQTSLKTTQDIGQRLDKAAQVIQGVQNQLGSLSKASEQILGVGKNVQGLMDILRSPKLRGNMGEMLLEQLLAQLLPRDRYVLQHGFRSGDKVDALIRLAEGAVPIDSKFPLENFRRLLEAPDGEREAIRKAFFRDVKKHVDAIATKYINPDEGTLDFALMFIPAENVYYEVISNGESAENIYGHALSRKVIPTGPSTFYAFLAAIALGLKGLQIAENARTIQSALARLVGEVDKARSECGTLGSHLKNASGSHERLSKQMEKVGDRLTALGEGTPVESALPPAPPLIDQVLQRP